MEPPPSPIDAVAPIDAAQTRRKPDTDNVDKDCCSGGSCCNKADLVSSSSSLQPLASMDHDHSHQEPRRKSGPDDADEDCCNGSSCCNNNTNAQTPSPPLPFAIASMDHDHNHVHSSSPCCGGAHPTPTTTHAHAHTHTASITPPPPPAPHLIPTAVAHLQVVSILDVCTSCDPLNPSAVPHAMQVTRIRVANLCCAMEEKIIMRSLRDYPGIERVTVNIIGRYAMITHCAVACCAPPAKIVDILNNERLGASLQESGGELDDEDKDETDWLKITYAATNLAVFFAGVGAQEATAGQGSQSVPSMVLFLIGTCMGAAPILLSACVAIKRRVVDISCLIMLAVAGALVLQEYLDACLIVSLFNAAECIEGAVMEYVRRAVKGSAARLPKRCFLIEEAPPPDPLADPAPSSTSATTSPTPTPTPTFTPTSTPAPNPNLNPPKRVGPGEGAAGIGAGKSVPVEGIREGDVVACRAGDMVLIDGVVRKGEGVLDESALTGEARGVHKKVGDLVTSGAVVQNGYLEIRALKVYKDSTMFRLHEAVEAVSAEKMSVSRIADVFAAYWTPAVLVCTLLFVVIGGGITSGPGGRRGQGSYNGASSSGGGGGGVDNEDAAHGGWMYYTHQGIILLVLACPCSIVIAAPIPAVCAIAAAARQGVLIRTSQTIEALGAVTTVAVDKTGTLTTGFFAEQGRLLLVGAC